VAGVDVHDRERELGRPERLLGQAQRTIESLPPENSSTGRSNSAATSRMMKMDSASSWPRLVSAWRDDISRINEKSKAVGHQSFETPQC
jgi:hypothetical protein